MAHVCQVCGNFCVCSDWSPNDADAIYQSNAFFFRDESQPVNCWCIIEHLDAADDLDEMIDLTFLRMGMYDTAS